MKTISIHTTQILNKKFEKEIFTFQKYIYFLNFLLRIRTSKSDPDSAVGKGDKIDYVKD